ncbi:hypothetical protein ACFSL6_11890 [Paenibacillus thailandensis]|uniref:Group-specific protein n=1 Tax=Paenibacillus thailandensis TaxID=393250 RepID=A0ABW5QZT9_9BACL
MANPLSNKKKIRGWKRRIKQIEQWKFRHINLDLEGLCRNHRDYVKVWIDPFYRLKRRNPPIWYSRLIVEAMLEVYQAWYQRMKQLNEPFYLKIWLYDPNFIQSQIVVAFRECLNFYDQTFEKSNNKKAFPCVRYGNITSLQLFKWELAVDSTQYLLSELLEDKRLGYMTEKDIEAIQKKAHKVETVKFSMGEDTVYSVKVGDVWLGEGGDLFKYPSAGLP